jgi:cell division septation protein DedD
MKKSRDGLLKDGTSRLARTGGQRRIPPVMWLAAVAIAAGAFFLFRGQGGGDSGIGDRRSVVTVSPDSALMGQGAAPRSGDVEIAEETRDLTPEQPAGATEPAVTEAEPEPAPPAPEPEPARQQTPAATTAAEPIVPAERGGWIVQTGSFGTASNADQEAARLRAAGLDARVKMGNLSDGTIAYRVRIGYFASREQARAYARQEKALIPGAIAVHR